MEVDSEQGRIPLFDTGPATLSEKGEPRFSKAASNITCHSVLAHFTVI